MHMKNWSGYVLKVNTRQRETTRGKHPKEFNNSGVYILTSFHNYDDLDKGIFGQEIGDKDRVQVYAGQARHFDSRTNDPKRLNDEDFFYLIGKFSKRSCFWVNSTFKRTYVNLINISGID